MVLDELRQRLETEFRPAELEIIDFSEEHAGHFQSPHSAQSHEVGTHLELRICSQKFQGLTRIQRERLVHALLQKELGVGRVHALVLRLSAPGEERMPGG
jgi:BolA protein